MQPQAADCRPLDEQSESCSRVLMTWLPFVFLCGNPAERIQEDSSISRSRSVKGRFRFLHGEKEWLFAKAV